MTDQNLAKPSSNPVIKKFDLPMELHIDYLRQMLTSKHDHSLNQALKVSYSSVKKESMDSSKLKGIRPSKSRDFDFVRDIALQLLLAQTCKQISIVGDTFDCGYEAHPDEPLPHRMFSWTREDFLNRRQAPNCMWVLVLQKSLTPRCLEVRKLRTDLECLQQLLELIFAAFQTKNLEMKGHVENFVKDTLAFENIFETLSKEADTNRVTLVNGLNAVLVMNFYRRESKNFEFRTNLEEQLVLANVWVPIEQRYQKHYYESRTNQHQIKVESVEEKLKGDIEQYVKMIERENFRTQCVVSLLFEEVERYKRRIAIMSERYDKDYEAVNNEISYKRTTMEKLKDQRKFYIEQIERFKEELEQSRLRIIFEEEVERERLRKLAEWKKKRKKPRRRLTKKI